MAIPIQHNLHRSQLMDLIIGFLVSYRGSSVSSAFEWKPDLGAWPHMTPGQENCVMILKYKVHTGLLTQRYAVTISTFRLPGRTKQRAGCLFQFKIHSTFHDLWLITEQHDISSSFPWSNNTRTLLCTVQNLCFMYKRTEYRIPPEDQLSWLTLSFCGLLRYFR